MTQTWDKFAQKVEESKIYFTHYALFEEPDGNVPAALYIDAATGQPTQELTLNPPIYERVFTRQSGQLYSAPTLASGTLPYFVDPPGFPPLPPPQPIVDVIAQVTGAPATVVQANTSVLLVAIGQFLAEGTTTGRKNGDFFEVQKTFRFQVRIRTGFIFKPPGNPAGNLGVLVGYLDFGTLHQLIQLPPPPNPTEVVVYDWKADFALSTDNAYVRKVSNEPKPVADPFDPTLDKIKLQGQQIDQNNRYTIVGHGRPQDVTFSAPPELVQFLFGTTQLTDVEFALSESGILVPL
jgi:hypothetical protein